MEEWESIWIGIQMLIKNNYKYSINDLKEQALILSDRIRSPCSVLLNGTLGKGKTTFSKFFIENILLDKSVKVTSPTFNIIQIYETTKGELWHIDLYRVKNECEIFELGILESMTENICLIEWPGLLKKYIKRYNYIEFDL